MRRQLQTTVAIALMSVASSVCNVSAANEALRDYVTRADASYEWHVHSRHRSGGAEILELRLSSQTWQGVLWKHRLFVIRPKRIDTERQGLLVIGGGRWRDTYDTEVADELPDDARLFVRIADRLRTTVTVLGQVPFQPLFGMTEDRVIAYTFDEYLRTEDPDWPLLLPMVKSAVRAMDATQELAAEQWGAELDTFTVLGGSKRGWTTWLSAVVDERVTAIAPAVFDALNFEAHFPHQTAAWGEPSDEIAPYTERNLHIVLASEAGRSLREIVDPFSYRETLTLPKLIVLATNDRYFPIDSLNLYWDALPVPKRVLYLPNEEHSIEDYRRLLGSLKAVHNYAATGAPLPELVWEFREAETRLRLCVRSSERPRIVQAWTAASDTRDFRDAHWSATRMRAEQGTWIFELSRPAAGFGAVFAEAVWGRGRSAVYLSSNLSVLGAPGAPEIGQPAASQAGICP